MLQTHIVKRYILDLPYCKGSLGSMHYIFTLSCLDGIGAKTRLKVRVTLSVAVNHRVTILNFLISSLLPLVLA